MPLPPTKTKVGPFSIQERRRINSQTVWLVDVPARLSPTGKRSRPSYPSKSAAIAEAKSMLRTLQLDGALRKNNQEAVGFTLSEVSERWLDWQMDRVTTQKKKLVSLETNAHRLRQLLNFMGPIDLSLINEDWAIQYQKKRLGERRAAATINSEIRLLKQIIHWAVKRQITARELDVEPLTEVLRRPLLPTIEEVKAILGHLPEKTALLVQFLAETGCRKGEAFNLEWTDVDFTQHKISIASKDGWTPKTRHSERQIPISPSLTSRLAEVKAASFTALLSSDQASKLVFAGRDGGKIWDFRKALKSAIEASGIQRNGVPIHLTPHMLRKANATWLAQRGISDAILQPHLGHAPGSSVTHKHYVHVQDEAILRGTVVDLAPRLRLVT